RHLEDGAVARHARPALVAPPRKLSRRDELASDVVQPQRLPDLAQLLDRVGLGLGCSGHHLDTASFVAAATICLLEIPAAFISSSGLPEVGSSLTARCTSRTGGSAASASRTAPARPPSG